MILATLLCLLCQDGLKSSHCELRQVLIQFSILVYIRTWGHSNTKVPLQVLFHSLIIPWEIYTIDFGHIGPPNFPLSLPRITPTPPTLCSAPIFFCLFHFCNPLTLICAAHIWLCIGVGSSLGYEQSTQRKAILLPPAADSFSGSTGSVLPTQ